MQIQSSKYQQHLQGGLLVLFMWLRTFWVVDATHTVPILAYVMMPPCVHPSQGMVLFRSVGPLPLPMNRHGFAITRMNRYRSLNQSRIRMDTTKANSEDTDGNTNSSSISEETRIFSPWTSLPPPTPIPAKFNPFQYDASQFERGGGNDFNSNNTIKNNKPSMSSTSRANNLISLRDLQMQQLTQQLFQIIQEEESLSQRSHLAPISSLSRSPSSQWLSHPRVQAVLQEYHVVLIQPLEEQLDGYNQSVRDQRYQAYRQTLQDRILQAKHHHVRTVLHILHDYVQSLE